MKEDSSKPEQACPVIYLSSFYHQYQLIYTFLISSNNHLLYMKRFHKTNEIVTNARKFETLKRKIYIGGKICYGN